MFKAILTFILGLILLPAGLLFLTLSLCLLLVDALIPGGRPQLLLIFPVGAVLLILGGARLIRARADLVTFFILFIGLSIIGFMCYIYGPLIEKAIPHLAQSHQIAKAKKAPGSKTVPSAGVQ